MIQARRAHDEAPILAVVADAGDWSLRALASLLDAHGFEVLPVHSPAQLLDQVERSHPHLVVLGGMLGTMPAVEAIRLLRDMPGFDRATPVLVASAGMVPEAERIRLLRAGAWESVGLPANSEELLLRIRRFVEARVVSDQARTQNLIDLQSGFYNLKGFLRRAGEEAAEAWRARRPLAFAVFTPDAESRAVLEADPTHPSGQALQRQLIEVFRRLGRRSDVVGRRGAATFLVLAPSTDELGVRRMADRFLREMHHLVLERGDVPPLDVTVAAGCHASGGPAAGGMDPGELLSRAAGALSLLPPEAPHGEVVLWRHGFPEDRSILEDPSESGGDPGLAMQA
jgi:PleD family two-component response regulator